MMSVADIGLRGRERASPVGVRRSIGFRRAALHLGGLWALAFAQPLLDLLGRNAEFFVARGSTTGDILLLAFGYVLLPPLIGAGVVWGAGTIRPELGWGVMLALVALLVAGLVLPWPGMSSGGPPSRYRSRSSWASAPPPSTPAPPGCARSSRCSPPRR